MKFSQRMGKSPIKVEIQLKSVDDDLRNGLWNVFSLFFLRELEKNHRTCLSFCEILWLHFYKLPIDEIPNYNEGRIEYIRKWYFECEWYEIYDFIEFIQVIDIPYVNMNEYRSSCNLILERELSGFRFVDDKIVPITNDIEIEEIERSIAIAEQTKFSGVKKHLTEALNKLSDRKNPDYRNSIKESISAVESICKIITGDNKAGFGQALNVLEDKIGLHGALKKGFSSIYGYTSDKDGIRHAMLDESTVDFEDAKYFLVSCSAFINYLIAKTQL